MMLHEKAMLAGIILSVGLILFILELVRRRRLREEYSLLWLTVGALFLIIALWSDGMNLLAKLVGIYYPPSALFLLGMVFIILLLLHVTTVISGLVERNKNLAQDIAILKEKLADDNDGET